MRSVFWLAVACMLWVGISPVYALDLDSAKAQGMVGEQADGYIAAVSATPSAEVQQLVHSINQKRKAHYRSISQEQSQVLETVEALAGAKLIERAAVGEYINTGGGWRKK